MIKGANKEQFKELSSEELHEILGLTIKKDDTNKTIAFLCGLSAYTDSSQMNICFNAPSSTGKSYIPLEISRYFPEEDVKTLGYCSPTAFFHDVGVEDPKNNRILVDLSRKIIIFLDQPHTLLLQHMRPVLSHDKKEISMKITDKTKSAGLRSKNIILRGYPSVIFCSAGLKLDEQEATRFFLLSPETTQEKIRNAVFEKVEKETDKKKYSMKIESNALRSSLKRRVEAIKEAGIKDVQLGDPEKVTEVFLKKGRILKPRDSRDVGRFISLVKMFALLNLWHREKREDNIVANQNDFNEAYKIWKEIYEAQEMNLPSYVYNFYKDIILSAYDEMKEGLSRADVVKKHYKVYGRPLSEWYLRREIVPLLENTGLVYQEKSPSDGRVWLIYPMKVDK